MKISHTAKSSIVAEKWPIFEKKLGQNLKELSHALISNRFFEKRKLSANLDNWQVAAVASYAPFNSSCPRTQNIKLLCYSQSKTRLHRNQLYFVTNIVGVGNREGKFE